MLSSLCPNDLGLKAGFWSGDEKDPVRFRPIVGWVVVSNSVEASFGPFLAVALSDLGFPTFLLEGTFPGFIGVFGNALTPEEARAKYEQWRKPAAGPGGPGGQSQQLN